MTTRSANWPGKAAPRIVCAAVRGMDNRLVVGPRHMDQTMRNTIREMTEVTSVRDWFDGAEQGFIDQFGDFYNRVDAWKVAEAAGQIFARCGGDTTDGGTLYSENLY